MSFFGRDIALEIFNPTLDDPVAIRQQAPVGNTPFEFFDIAAFADQGAGVVNADIGVDAGSILIEMDSQFSGFFSDPGPDGFNGYVFSDPIGFGDIPPIVDVDIRLGGLLDVPPQQVYYNDNAIYVDMSGVDFRDGDQIIFDVTFDDRIAGTQPPQYIQDIARLYEAGLGREAEATGFNYWIDTFESGALGDTSQRFSGPGQPLSGLETMAGYFLFSPEFQSTADFDIQSDPRAFVELLYFNVLDRPGEAAGVNYWTDLLASQRISYEETLVYFAISPENEAGTPYADDIALNLTGTEWFVV